MWWMLDAKFTNPFIERIKEVIIMRKWIIGEEMACNYDDWMYELECILDSDEFDKEIPEWTYGNGRGLYVLTCTEETFLKIIRKFYERIGA